MVMFGIDVRDRCDYSSQGVPPSVGFDFVNRKARVRVRVVPVEPLLQFRLPLQ